MFEYNVCVRVLCNCIQNNVVYNPLNTCRLYNSFVDKVVNKCNNRETFIYGYIQKFDTPCAYQIYFRFRLDFRLDFLLDFCLEFCFEFCLDFCFELWFEVKRCMKYPATPATTKKDIMYIRGLFIISHIFV